MMTAAPSHPTSRSSRRSHGRISRLVGTLLLILSLTSPAIAGEKKGAKDGVIDLGQITVEGKVQKPQVFYVLGRSQFRYQGLKLRRSFLGKILQSTQKNPF